MNCPACGGKDGVSILFVAGYVKDGFECRCGTIWKDNGKKVEILGSANIRLKAA